MSLKAKLVKPTDNDSYFGKRIFLAGSIEMGSAEDWQTIVFEKLKNYPVTVFNPRRDSWDTSWPQKQSASDFNFQVNWELNHIEQSEIVFMYFDPNTKSPISLLELGLLAYTKKLIVCCPENFWRRGNVEIVCTRNNIPLYQDLYTAIGALETKILQLN